jgi:glycosyltransferase involved in cell wall biosynthesis
MRILFVTRNFPPSLGGLERMAFLLYQGFIREKQEVCLLRCNKGRIFFLLSMPFFLMRALLSALFRDIDVVYLFDAALAPFIPFLKISGKPIVMTAHGLDITYKNRLYQFIVAACARMADGIICISRATAKECLTRGIPEDMLTIIPDGIDDVFYTDKAKALKKDASKIAERNIGEKKILLSVCRLIERKGIHWFIERVMPLVASEYTDCLYIVVGEGGLSRRIDGLIRSAGLSQWVVRVGSIDDDALKTLYNIADVFLMPNIPVKGDMEGFGVVALEAASCRIPVVASHLEGIADALLDGAMGVLVPAGDENAFKEAVLGLLHDEKKRLFMGRQSRDLVLEHFSLKKIVNEYLSAFNEQRKGRAC